MTRKIPSLEERLAECEHWLAENIRKPATNGLCDTPRAKEVGRANLERRIKELRAAIAARDNTDHANLLLPPLGDSIESWHAFAQAMCIMLALEKSKGNIAKASLVAGLSERHMRRLIDEYKSPSNEVDDLLS